MTQSVCALSGCTGSTTSMNSTAGRSASDRRRAAGTSARTQRKSPWPNEPRMPSLPPRMPWCPSQTSIPSGASPGNTTIRTSTEPEVGTSACTFQEGSNEPTQSTNGSDDNASRSAGEPRTTNASCGMYRRTVTPRTSSRGPHSALIGAWKWTTPIAWPLEERRLVQRLRVPAPEGEFAHARRRPARHAISAVRFKQRCPGVADFCGGRVRAERQCGAPRRGREDGTPGGRRRNLREKDDGECDRDDETGATKERAALPPDSRGAGFPLRFAEMSRTAH